MAKPINLLTTIKGSLLEGFYPRGWNLKRIDQCCAMGFKKLTTPARHWDKNFKPVAVKDVASMDKKMGLEIVRQIQDSRIGRLEYQRQCLCCRIVTPNLATSIGLSVVLRLK